MSRRKVSNPLALAVLACLAEGPMHPYEIASTLRQRHKDVSIKLNYGSLYSVIDALGRNGMVAPKETVRQGKRPERTIYELTGAGHHELTDWLSELLARPVKEYTAFEAGLSLMPVLPPQTAVALLNQRTLQASDFRWDLNQCLLKESGAKTFTRHWDERLGKTIQHRKLNKKVSYQQLIRLECYKLVRHVIGDQPYKPLKIWW